MQQVRTSLIDWGIKTIAGTVITKEKERIRKENKARQTDEKKQRDRQTQT